MEDSFPRYFETIDLLLLIIMGEIIQNNAIYTQKIDCRVVKHLLHFC